MASNRASNSYSQLSIAQKLFSNDFNTRKDKLKIILTHWFKIKFVENSREILFGIELKINTFEWAKKKQWRERK